MPEETTRASGITLTRDSRDPYLLHVRYNSDNLKNVTGTIRPDGDGWRVSVDLPSPPILTAIEPIDSLRINNPETLSAAIEDLENRIRLREELFAEYHRNVSLHAARHRREIDDLFGDGA